MHVPPHPRFQSPPTPCLVGNCKVVLLIHHFAQSSEETARHWKMLAFAIIFATVFALILALSIYVLVAIVKKQLGLDLSPYKILQILSVTVFEKTPFPTSTMGSRMPSPATN